MYLDYNSKKSSHVIRRRIYNDKVYIHEASVPQNAPNWTIKQSINNTALLNNNKLGFEYNDDEFELSPQYIGKVFYRNYK